MASRLLRDPDEDGWERSDMPIVCETCLGPNPFVRMQRVEFGGTCHISGRPYTVFRWRPGNEARYKKTIICQEVAKAKNVCQVCLLDLEFGLPVQVRDSALGIQSDDGPQSDVGKEFELHQRVKDGDMESSFSQTRPNDVLLRLQRTSPYYQRNKAQICSFFVKGMCNRGAECPYRHEMPITGELADQNIKDRYYGINDPVANKMLRRLDEVPKLQPPEDTSITTLYIGGLTADITEDDIRDQFYSLGEIASLKKVDSKMCAFVTFTTRAAAEKAAEEMHNKLIIKGARCKVLWGKPQQPQQPRSDAMQPSTSGRPTMMPPQVAIAMGGAAPIAPSGPNYFGLQPGSGPMYASMDPSAMGTRIPAPGEQKRPADAGPAADAPEHGSDAKKQRTVAPQQHSGAAPSGGAMPAGQQQQQPPSGPPPPYGMAGPPPRGPPPPVPPFPPGMPPFGMRPPPGMPPRPMPPLHMPHPHMMGMPPRPPPPFHQQPAAPHPGS